MVNPIDETRVESSLDDTQDIDIDLDSLKQRFIDQIDRLRSQKIVNLYSRGRKLGKTGLVEPVDVEASMTTELQESRAHCLLRIMGMPVVAPNGKFYSPGFNPTANADETIARTDILENLLQEGSVNKIFRKELRESQPRDNLSVFSFANRAASLYSICLEIPRPFNIYADGDEDQVSSIPERLKFISSNYLESDGSEISDISPFYSVRHMLFPLETDPIICGSVAPEGKLICVPFLEKNDTEIEPGKFLKRPGIELILRLRLKQQLAIESGEFGSAQSADFNIGDFGIFNLGLVELIFDPTDAVIISSAFAVIEEAARSDIAQEQGFPLRIELYTLNDFVKTLKALVRIFREALESIAVVRSQIKWIPLCSEKGPDGGTENKGVLRAKKFNYKWELDKRLLRQKLKASVASRHLSIGLDSEGCFANIEPNYSDFATGEFQSVVKKMDEEVADTEGEIIRLETQASDALRIIELISGEVSGLGLIDIIAIYTALWSVDVPTLLGIIDDSAFDRLKKIKNLQSSDVVQGNRVEVTQAIRNIEERVISILSYVDRLLERERSSRDDESESDIPRG
jgi:hypothetical protein